jgi:hypothetical protein
VSQYDQYAINPGITDAAANMVAGNSTAYTADMFAADYAQFTGKGIPTAIMTAFLAMANDAIQEARWGDMWRVACGWYVAHCCTLHLRAMPAAGATVAAVVEAGNPQGLVTEESFGGDSESYDHTAITAALQSWGNWNSTEFGRQLATMGRLVGAGGAFVI